MSARSAGRWNGVSFTLTGLLSCCVAACAKGALQTMPASGTVTVGVTSRGPGVQTMTFTVSIEPAGLHGSVKGDIGVFTADHTPAGNHVVRLEDLPARCRVDGDSERKIIVSANRSAIVRFMVVCD